METFTYTKATGVQQAIQAAGQSQTRFIAGGTTLLDLGGLQVKLEELLGVQVDLLTPGDLPRRARDRVLSDRAHMTSQGSGLKLADVLEHIAETARLAREYVGGMSEESFLQDRRTQQVSF